jgi:hypothetical protein
MPAGSWRQVAHSGAPRPGEDRQIVGISIPILRKRG